MSTFTSATGNAARMSVNASEILVSGRGANGFSSTLGANAFLPDESLQQAFFIPPFPTGDTGKVTLNAEQITVRDGGAINVQHAGTGNAGQLRVNANRVLLDQGSILANTAFGNGGNLNLNIDGILLLRNNSLISTTAGTAFQPGDGGNMDIRTGFVVAVPDENSDIIANAFQGNGGRIEISTNEIIGLEFRNELTPESDITAFTDSPQEFSQGEFRLIRFEPGVLDKISDLPEPNLVDPSNQIIAGCPSTQGNRFVVTGRGGIPDDPRQYLRGRAVWRDMRNLSAREGSGQPITVNQRPITNQTPLVEAQGWIVEENGTVILTAEPSSDKLPSPRITSQSCQNQSKYR
ncbi:MAG: S-layer family protein [Coleofasciculaceae cyanobacterium]